MKEAQLEVDRVAGETISVLRSDATAAGFSQSYDDAFSDLRIAAARSGCAAADLARQTLNRIDTVRADGPVAVADKADIVSDLADRAGRSPLLIGPDASNGALEVALVDPIAPLGPTGTCRQLGAAWLSVYQSLLQAMDSVPLETYLDRSGVRDSDIRDNPDNDGRGLHFANRGLDDIVTSLLQRGQDISCSDDDTAARIIEGGDTLVAKSATSAVFKADQLAIAQLFLTGV